MRHPGLRVKSKKRNNLMRPGRLLRSRAKRIRGVRGPAPHALKGEDGNPPLALPMAGKGQQGEKGAKRRMGELPQAFRVAGKCIGAIWVKGPPETRGALDPGLDPGEEGTKGGVRLHGLGPWSGAPQGNFPNRRA